MKKFFIAISLALLALAPSLSRAQYAEESYCLNFCYKFDCETRDKCNECLRECGGAVVEGRLACRGLCDSFALSKSDCYAYCETYPAPVPPPQGVNWGLAALIIIIFSSIIFWFAFKRRKH